MKKLTALLRIFYGRTEKRLAFAGDSLYNLSAFNEKAV